MDRVEKIKIAIMILILIMLISFVIYYIMGSKKAEEQKVVLHIKEKGQVVIKLYPEKAPNTVANFLNLANSGYYNGKIVYGKDYSTIHIGRTKELLEEVPTLKYLGIEDERKDIKYNIDGEFSKNGKVNNLKHKKYWVTMVRANYSQIDPRLEEEGYNSAGGLFNIVMEEDAGLDGKYAVFGEVIEGKEILDEIYSSKVKGQEKYKVEELKTQLLPFDEKIEIEKAESNVKIIPEVKWHEAFDFDKYLIDLIKKSER